MQWDKIEEYAQYVLNKSQEKDDEYLHEMCWKLVNFTRPKDKLVQQPSLVTLTRTFYEEC